MKTVKKAFKVIFWLFAGLLASKLANGIVFAMLNDATTGISSWRATVPAVCGSSALVYCWYLGYKTLKEEA